MADMILETDLQGFESEMRRFALTYPGQSQHPAVYRWGDGDTHATVTPLDVDPLPIATYGVVPESVDETTFWVRPQQMAPAIPAVVMGGGTIGYHVSVRRVGPSRLEMSETAVGDSPYFGPAFAKAWVKHCHATWRVLGHAVEQAPDALDPTSGHASSIGDPIRFGVRSTSEPTIGDFEKAEQALERGELGARERLDSMSREANFADYAAMLQWLSDNISKPIMTAIENHFGPTEVRAIMARLDMAESDPVWRGMLRSSKLSETPLAEIVRDVRAELVTAPSIRPAPYTAAANGSLTTSFTSTLQTQTRETNRGQSASAGSTADGTKVISYEPHKLEPSIAEAVRVLLGLPDSAATASDNRAPAALSERRVPGRPAIKDYDWAYVEVEEKGRPFGEVFAEWEVTPKAAELAEPRKSLKNAIEARRKKNGKKR